MTRVGDPVDVVVPYFQRADLLGELLETLVGQRYPAWRAIVVDDGSPDPDALRAAVRRVADPRIRVVRHERNRGIAAARNTGVRAGDAELIAVVDADDRLAPEFLQRLVEHFVADDRLDYAVPDMRCFGLEERTLALRVLTAETVLYDDYPPSGKMMRRRLWERVGGWDEGDGVRLNHEGWGFHIRAFTSGCVAVHVREPLYHWRIWRDAPSRRLGDHHVRRAIYERHRALFDARRAGPRFLSLGYLEAAGAHLDAGHRASALALAALACWQEPTRRNLGHVVDLALGRRTLPTARSRDP